MSQIPEATAVNRLVAALKRCPQGATLGGLALGNHSPNTINYAVAMSLIEVRHERVNGVGRMDRYFAKQERP